MMKSILYISIFFILTLNCYFDEATANEKRTEECRNLAFLQITQAQSGSGFTAEEQSILNNSEIKLAYSCSSVEGNSPSCREFFTLTPEQTFLSESCLADYTKSSATCSRQNPVGECRIVDTTNSRYEVRVYAEPNDNIESAKNDCLISGGNFTDPATSPLLPALLVACGFAEE